MSSDVYRNYFVEEYKPKNQSDEPKCANRMRHIFKCLLTAFIRPLTAELMNTSRLTDMNQKRSYSFLGLWSLTNCRNHELLRAHNAVYQWYFYLTLTPRSPDLAMFVLTDISLGPRITVATVNWTAQHCFMPVQTVDLMRWGWKLFWAFTLHRYCSVCN